jgi:tRNA pseudouridine55 synthase
MARRQFRKVNGVLLLDKPLGMTSNAALQEVKHLFRAQKAGHTGSLDPLATGLLPICMGEATKISAFLLSADKHYRVRCRLGERTTTGDAEGEVIERRPVSDCALDRLEVILGRFRGEIEQIPPMYSALKYQGDRLYNLARQGVEVERAPRRVTIHALDLLAASEAEFEIDVRCSKGTYVRTLAEDIGEALGCGAHVVALRRLGVGPFDAPAMHELDALRARAADGFEALDAALLPLDQALTDWPKVVLGRDSVYYLRQGQPVLVPRAPTQGWVRLYTDEHFFGVGEILDDGRVAPRRLFLL